MRSWSAGGLHTTLDNIIGRVSEVSEKFHKASTLGSFPRNFRKRALFMGDHGRSTLGHVVAKKSRGYYCPPYKEHPASLAYLATVPILAGSDAGF